MHKVQLRKIANHVFLYRDEDTGIAWVENGKTGVSHSCHPNIHETGSAMGMVRRGHWKEIDRVVRCGIWQYNVSHCIVSDEYDEIARRACQCGGYHGEER